MSDVWFYNLSQFAGFFLIGCAQYLHYAYPCTQILDKYRLFMRKCIMTSQLYPSFHFTSFSKRNNSFLKSLAAARCVAPGSMSLARLIKSLINRVKKIINKIG